MFRVAIAATACAVVAGCGFEPLHARKTGAAPSLLAKIRIEPITDRIGQQLHNLLLDRLNPKGRPVAAHCDLAPLAARHCPLPLCALTSSLWRLGTSAEFVPELVSTKLLSLRSARNPLSFTQVPGVAGRTSLEPPAFLHTP